WRPALPGDKLHKITTLLDNAEPDAIYRRLVSQWERPDEVAATGSEPHGPLWDPSIARDFPDLVPRMQFLDMISYLPEDILTKVDRATMAVGLEGRVPLLDHRVVAYSWSLPLAFKVRGGRGKWLLRRVLDRYVPRSLIDRPKMGFGVRSMPGCEVLYGNGRNRCSLRRGLRLMGSCGSRRCAGRGRNISKALATGSIRCGPC